jgi:hypothetical protein
VRIVYLDQNKWIELARAAKFPAEYPDLHALLEAITQEVSAGRLALPLTATNIYETHKINDPQRRHDLASVQAYLSRGLVFRGRHKRLEAEVTDVLRSAYGLPSAPREQNWFLSNVFFEAFAEWGDERFGFAISERVLEFIRNRPDFFLYDYWLATPEDVRLYAVRTFSDGSEQLRQRIEDRRRRHANESLSLRRRIQNVILLDNEIELIIGFAKKAGIPWSTVTDIGGSNARRIMSDVPTYYVEREIGLRLEAQTRPIDENDFRDMQSFCAIVPYADEVITENHFASLAQQAGLDKKYDTRITTSIVALKEYLQAA